MRTDQLARQTVSIYTMTWWQRIVGYAGLYTPSRAGLWFLFTVLVSSATILPLLGYTFGRFEYDIIKLYGHLTTNHQYSYVRTVPTYLALFIFAEIYQLVLSSDAIRTENTIQVVGICFFNVAMLVYSSLQYNQIEDTARELNIHQAFDACKRIIIAIPCVTAATLLILVFLTYQIHQDFGWSIFKQVGADIASKRRYLCYLIYVTLLKFDFFFFLGFTVQFVVVVLEHHDVEFALTITVIPITIIVLWLAAYSARKESLVGMIIMIIIYLAGMAYFIFKLVRIYEPSQAYKYLSVRKTLTVFAVLTIIFLVATIIAGTICTINFGKGLRKIVEDTKDARERESKRYSTANDKMLLDSPIAPPLAHKKSPPETPAATPTHGGNQLVID